VCCTSVLDLTVMVDVLLLPSQSFLTPEPRFPPPLPLFSPAAKFSRQFHQTSF